MIGVSRGAIWALVMMLFAVTCGALDLVGRSLEFGNVWPQILLVMLGGWLAIVRDRLGTGTLTHVRDALELLALFGVLSATGALASYFVAIQSSGYADDLLAKVGPMLGFNWTAAYAFTATHPAVAVVGRFAYLSIFWMPFILLTGFALTGRADRGRVFLFAFAIAIVLTMILFYALPAKGPLAYFGARPDYMPTVRFDEVEIIDALRQGRMTTIDLARLSGIVNFPSFHAGAAILFMWGAWPIPRLRWPVMIINVLMLMSTPVEGTHYIVDVLGGVAVAITAIGSLYLPRLLSRASPRRLFSPEGLLVPG